MCIRDRRTREGSGLVFPTALADEYHGSVVCDRDAFALRLPQRGHIEFEELAGVPRHKLIGSEDAHICVRAKDDPSTVRRCVTAGNSVGAFRTPGGILLVL